MPRYLVFISVVYGGTLTDLDQFGLFDTWLV